MPIIPGCPYCREPMSLSDGSYWCMNKQCPEQFYPSGNDDLARAEWNNTQAAHDGNMYPPDAEAAIERLTAKCENGIGFNEKCQRCEMTNIEEMAREINELRDVLGRLRDWIERGVPVVEQEGLYKLVRITLGGE